MAGLENFGKFPFKLLNSYEKWFSNIDTKILNENSYIDLGFNLIGRKDKRKVCFRNNSNK